MKNETQTADIVTFFMSRVARETKRQLRIEVRCALIPRAAKHVSSLLHEVMREGSSHA
jgi:hypothetical protein